MTGQATDIDALRAYVGAWIEQLRDLIEQHEEFTDETINLIDETGLHYSLRSELEDLADIVTVLSAPPLPSPAGDGE